MTLSDQIKRFFKAFAWTRVFLFRRLLQTLFIWRLRIKQPAMIELGIDTMVMDNDDAACRQDRLPQRGDDPESVQCLFGESSLAGVVQSMSNRTGYRIAGEKMHGEGKVGGEVRPKITVLGLCSSKIRAFMALLELSL